MEDSGIGISKENVKKLFTSETRIEFEGRQTLNPTGVGLELNIAFNLAELLGPQGQKGINFSSVPNQGSIFTFIIENKKNTLTIQPEEYKELDSSSIPRLRLLMNYMEASNKNSFQEFRKVTA